MAKAYNIKSLPIGLFIISVLLLSNSCRKESFSPSQADSFIKFFGTYQNDKGADVRSLDEGGYVLAGTTTTETSGTNIILIQTDKYGNETGTPKQFGGTFNDRAHSISVLSDGRFAILGSTTVELNDQTLVTDMYFIVTDSDGNEIWSKNYNYGDNENELDIVSNEIGYSFSETSDGGFILIGSTENLETGKKNIYLVRTGPEGEVIWTRTHGGLDDDVGFNIAETDDGFIYTGYTRNFSQPDQSDADIFIVKTNSLGRVTFPYTYGSEGDDFGRALIPHNDGGYILLGTATNPSSNIKNIFLGHIGEDISQPIWTKSIGGSLNHNAACIKITPGGNYIITGTQELSPGNHVIFLTKTDSEGNQIFFETYGGGGLQKAEAVDITEDGGYIITGSNETGGISMITLIKTDENGKL
ncbi:MAG: hypothetical protein ACLFQA_02765 [Bacteroidales bacterium]